MQSRADSAAPAKATVAERAGIVAVLQEAFWFERVRIGEIGFVEVDYSGFSVITSNDERELVGI